MHANSEEKPSNYHQAQEMEMQVFSSTAHGIDIEDRHNRIVGIHEKATDIELLTQINKKLIEDQYDP